MGSDQAQPQPQSTHQPHEPQPDSIVAICENRKLEVGMACLRMSDYSVELSQVADDQAYSKAVTMLARHEPRLLLFHTRGDVLERICKAEFPQTRIDHLARSNWSPERGLTAVRHYSARSVAAVLGTDVQAKYLCLSALSALVFFFEEVQKMQLVKGTLRISHRPCDGVMLLDPSTIANLEILRNLRTSCPKASLFGVLNQCKTAAGARMLRSSLTQPSKDLDTIQLRVEAVSELLPRDEALIDLAKILPQFAESDRLLRQLVQRSELSNAVARARESIKTILLLKQTLRAAPVLAASLTSNGEVPLANELLLKLHENFTAPELGELTSLIDEIIDEDAVFDKRKTTLLTESLFAVIQGVRGCPERERTALDACRKMLSDSTDQINDMAKAWAQEELDVDVKYSDRRGYHFLVPMAQRDLAQERGQPHERASRVAWRDLA